MLKQSLFALIVVALAVTASQAQNPRVKSVRHENMDSQLSLGQLTPTPSMWFYQQEREQYMDPNLAVRRKAEFDTWQRKSRIASAKWYGYSASRPLASHTPFTYYYSPFWSGNTKLPYVWTPQEKPVVHVHSHDDYRGN